jgi:SAM-dependent methyltransferase
VADSKTPYRDAWADSKQATVPQALQSAAALFQEIGRGSAAMDQITRQMAGMKSFREFYASVERLAEISRSVSYNAHNLKLLCDFIVPPATLFTDHYLNQYFLMSAFTRTWWAEGPAICGLAIEPGARILDLGCGTGYYTAVFYAPFASEVVGIDIDPRAIETARRLHAGKNIRYEVMDFCKELPPGPFDVVIWTPTIIAYSPSDVHKLMQMLKKEMTERGCLCGFTGIEADHAGPDILWHDMRSLAERLKLYFKDVRSFERLHATIQPPRHCLYFYASDGPLPFDNGWLHGVRLSRTAPHATP